MQTKPTDRTRAAARDRSVVLFSLLDGGRAAGGLRDQAEPGLGDRLDPAGDLHPLLLGGLEVLEVLLERVVVELREELGLGGLVELADAVDELTFVHGKF